MLNKSAAVSRLNISHLVLHSLLCLLPRLNLSHLVLRSLLCLLPTQGRPQLKSTESLPTDPVFAVVGFTPFRSSGSKARQQRTRSSCYFRPARSITSSSGEREAPRHISI
jgi:hypothetical protein